MHPPPDWGCAKERVGEGAGAPGREVCPAALETDAWIALNPSPEPESHFSPTQALPPSMLRWGAGVGHWGGKGDVLTAQVSLPPSRCPTHIMTSVTFWG